MPAPTIYTAAVPPSALIYSLPSLSSHSYSPPLSQTPSTLSLASTVGSMKNPSPIPSDLKALISAARTRRTKLFACGFVFAFVVCTAFLAFNPSSNSASPWFYNLFSSSSASSLKASFAPYRSQVSSLISHLFPNSSSSAANQVDSGGGPSKGAILGTGSVQNGAVGENRTQVRVGSKEKGADSGKNGVLGKNHQVKNGTASNKNTVGLKKDGALVVKNQTVSSVGSKGSEGSKEKQGKKEAEITKGAVPESKNQTATNGVTFKSNGVSASTQKGSKANSTQNGQKGSTQKGSKANSTQNGQKGIGEGTRVSNSTSSLAKRSGSAATAAAAKPVSDGNGKKREKWIEDMIGCDIFHGHWVKDDSYPLYPEGSCPHIDEPFDCYLNGRPDRSFQKLRWQPAGCNIPRLNATDMLERLRGKRLVFVGDSLNRNMWESLVCVLRNSVKDKKMVFEASGRHEFRTEGSYSFLFKDYGATVEFFRSPFLVQEWEMPSGNGTKETLRLDLIERSSSKYKDAHVIIFNTGHWWTHEKTSKGKDYYQEGNRVYSELNVVEAFHKALNTWAKWVDANVNPKKSLVSFRGYSASHFSGGQWNSGGACDKETEPIKNEKYLSSYPPKMSVLESVIKGMKTPVSYLNITRMTDYRKDAHPSVYRKQNLTEEERRDPLRFQDCSHWCLPGVPDTWNELLYAQLIIKQYQMAQ